MTIEKLAPVRLNYEDYCALPEDGKRYEIIDGDLFMSPAPSFWHQRYLVRMLTSIGKYLELHPVGEVVVAPLDVILDEENIVQPDLIFISTAKSHLIVKRGLEGAPDLVVEVLSPSNRRRDEVAKRTLYERFGVEEYWMVDPEADTVRVHRLTDEGYIEAVVLTADAEDVLTSPMLSGFALPLDTLFT
ncbi:MAG: Uma2 family endonuclease [Rhodothermales bacterium]